MFCPIHQIEMPTEITKNGLMSVCPVVGCNIIALNGKLSKRATKGNKKYRKLAHKVFDRSWRTSYDRTLLYQELAIFMGKSIEQTHIGLFGIDECKKVIKFSKLKKKYLTKNKVSI